MKTLEQVNKQLDDKTEIFKGKQMLFLYNNGHIERIDDEVVEDKEVAEKQEVTIKLSDILNPAFYHLFNETITQPYRVFKGGRSSFKSSAISIKLVYDFLQDDKANTICFRKVGKYLSTSVYEQIKWAIMILNVQDEFTFLKSPLKIIHNRTNTAFYFYGVDDPLKIKSAKIAEGYVKDLWYEEAAEFDGKVDIDTVNDTFVREELPDGKQVNVYYSYNPPRNPYSWINEWLKEIETDKAYHIHHSTYEDDKKGFLSKQFLERIEKVRKNDPDYYNWMYKGAIIGLGDVVYNMKLFKLLNEVPTDDRLLFADIAIDTGYANSATTFLYIGYTVKGKSILLDTYYYSPANVVDKKAPSDFSEDLWEFVQKNVKIWKAHVDTWTIDSADAALRNQFAKDKGIYLTPVRKGKKFTMIENVRDHQALGNAYILRTENNKIFIDEHKKYQWDEKTKDTKEPKVIEKDDHTCDAYQYYVVNNKSKLKLAV